MEVHGDRLIRGGLKLSHLRLLSALGETGQISAAAARLAMSQPAASRLLAELDGLVGAGLYTRHARGIVLTPAGRALSETARRMLRDLDAADRQIGEMASGRRGLVTIGSVTGPSLELALPVLRRLRVTHPGIAVNIDVDTSDKLTERLLAASLDLVIGRIPQSLDHRLFVAEPLGTEPISLIVRKGHPLTRGSGHTLKSCIPYDWVLQAQGSLLRQTVETYLLERRLPLPARVVGTSSILMTLAIVSQSNAIAPVSSAVADFVTGHEGLDARIVKLDLTAGLAVSAYSMLRDAAHPLSPPAATVWSAIAMIAGAGEDADAAAS